MIKKEQQSVEASKLSNSLVDTLSKFAGVDLALEVPQRNFLYNTAASSCQVGNYTNAIPIFQLLLLQDGNNSLYLKSLAGCYHAMHDYLNGYSYYNLAYINRDTKNKSAEIDCLFYMADCLIKLVRFNEAKRCLNDFIACPDNAHKDLVARAKILLNFVNKKIAESLENSHEK